MYRNYLKKQQFRDVQNQNADGVNGSKISVTA